MKKLIYNLCVFTIALLLFACGSGSSSPSQSSSNTSPSAPATIGTLPNGSSVIVSSAVFGASQGTNITGSISLVGGSGNSSYAPTFSISNIGAAQLTLLSTPTVTVNPSNCLLSASNPSCQIIINSTSAAPGTYSITPTFT